MLIFPQHFIGIKRFNEFLKGGSLQVFSSKLAYTCSTNIKFRNLGCPVKEKKSLLQVHRQNLARKSSKIYTLELKIAAEIINKRVQV